MKMFIVMCACIVSLSACSREVISLQNAPPLFETSETKKQRNETLVMCEESIGRVDAEVPMELRKKYCKCFVSESEKKFPRGFLNIPEERLADDLYPSVKKCYALHIASWHLEHPPVREPPSFKGTRT